MRGPCSEKIAAYPQDQSEKRNDRVLVNFCHTVSILSIFVYSSAYFRPTSFFLRCLLIFVNRQLWRHKFFDICVGPPKVLPLYPALVSAV